MNFLEIVGVEVYQNCLQREGISAKEYLENCAGGGIKIIGIVQSQIPMEIGEEQLVNNIRFRRKANRQ